MFPVVKLMIEGLEAHGMYEIDLEFVQIGSNRWKYMNGDWVTGGKAEPAPSFNRYRHPESPNFGHHWMKEEVSFSKVKLTNKPSPQAGQVSAVIRRQSACVSVTSETGARALTCVASGPSPGTTSAARE